MRSVLFLAIAPFLCAAAQFEVATIRPVPPDTAGLVGVQVYPGGRLVLRKLPLKAMIVAAFDVSYWQISGDEPWMREEPYEVEAKPPADPPIRNLRYTNDGVDDPTLRQMLQALLIGRFQLKFHRESKIGDVRLLEQNGRTLRLKPSETAAPRKEFGSIGYVGAKWSIFSTTMPQLARFAADKIVHGPVLDRTGLDGQFDYRQTIPDAEPNYSDPSPSFGGFLSEAGLTLRRSKGPVETFVIDSAARPSAN